MAVLDITAGTETNPIPVSFNVAQYHIQKTDDCTDFILGDFIVTDMFASTVCIVKDVIQSEDDPNCVDITVDDGTDYLEYPNISIYSFSPQVWSQLKIIMQSRLDGLSTSASSPLSSQQQDNMPVMLEVVFQLNIDDEDGQPSCSWVSCQIFKHSTLPSPQSIHCKEWHDIVQTENIQKGSKFFSTFCYRRNRAIGDDEDEDYNSIINNPYQPIHVSSLVSVTNPPVLTMQPGGTTSRVLYFGEDVTYRLLAPSPFSLSRIEPSTQLRVGYTMINVLRVKPGNSTVDDVQKSNDHATKAKLLAFELKCKQHGGKGKFQQYQAHIAKVHQMVETIKLNASKYPLLSSISESINKKLEEFIQNNNYSLKQAELFCSTNWNATDDFMNNTQQIVNGILQLDESLIEGFYQDYFPFVEAQLDSLQQQLQMKTTTKPKTQETSLLQYQLHAVRPSSSMLKRSYVSVPHQGLFGALIETIQSTYPSSNLQDDGTDNNVSQSNHIDSLTQSTTTLSNTPSHIKHTNTLYSTGNFVEQNHNSNNNSNNTCIQTLFDIFETKEKEIWNIVTQKEQMIDYQQKILEAQRDVIKQKDSDLIATTQKYNTEITKLQSEISSLKTTHDLTTKHQNIVLQKDATITNTNTSLIDILNNQISILNQQLETKDKQLQIKDSQLTNKIEQHNAQLQAKEESCAKQIEINNQRHQQQLENKEKEHAAQLQAKDQQIEMLLELLANKDKALLANDKPAPFKL